MAESTIETKNLIRAKTRAARASRSDSEKTLAALGLTEQLKKLVEDQAATKLTCYFPVRGEPSTIPFLEWAGAEGISVLLPSSREDGLLDWVIYEPQGEAMAGLYGIPEPAGERLSPIAANDVDLMLIPASAVDKTGMRLGWGRGFYDRSIGSMENKPPVFAIVYDDEVITEVPRETHDVPVSGVVTPTRTIVF